MKNLTLKNIWSYMVTNTFLSSKGQPLYSIKDWGGGGGGGGTAVALFRGSTASLQLTNAAYLALSLLQVCCPHSRVLRGKTLHTKLPQGTNDCSLKTLHIILHSNLHPHKLILICQYSALHVHCNMQVPRLQTTSYIAGLSQYR